MSSSSVSVHWDIITLSELIPGGNSLTFRREGGGGVVEGDNVLI